NLDEMLQRFWSIEYSNEADDVYTETEKYCLQHFKNNIKRSADGKYIVSLPFDLESGKLGNSKRAAMAQFLQLEQRFRSNDGHMKLCEPTLESESFYLPHHAVFKDSTTTKLRTVFDASRPTSTGISLNDKLLVGPKLQENLFNIMLRFRIHRIAFTADIAKMYRQIWMDESQCDYQKILWRWNENEDIKEYRLTTITYGTSPAPFLATAVVKYHAENSYMDDVSSGCDDVNTAIRLQREITAILAEAGMPLRKWATNNLEFLNKIPLEHREGAPLNFDVDNESSISTLGMSWNCKDDKVSFVVRLKNPLQHYTKRQILSEISRMYDPIGLLSPIDRWIKYRPNCRVELHGFADASGKAYGPAIYIKVYLENKVYVNIIASKSRIAPINKTVTLPKLELCAAHLLTKLMTEVKKSLKINIAATKYYSDSEITIAWIKSTKKKYKQFVANRVNEIREVSEPSEWFWIGTKENPADFVSRGLLPSQIINNEMWWHGPKWLLENENNFQEVNLDVDSEVKKRH
ncbi:uncharacterized protein LOC116347361, partial [Contarinia nasturtii]|uniref:uncharacterized protein LOC116347361 n=1 Tax=Contarinia nasturtii TaxID=265458 RepID=UPI0012D3995F